LVARQRSDVHLTAVALRRSPLRDVDVDCLVSDPSQLQAALDLIETTPGPHLLLIDDAECVDDGAGRLSGLLGARRPDLRVVVAGRSDALRSAYGHWTAAVRRARAGALLQPHIDVDGELWQMALPRHGPTAFPAGRGYLLCDRGFELVQFAGPEARTM